MSGCGSTTVRRMARPNSNCSTAHQNELPSAISVMEIVFAPVPRTDAKTIANEQRRSKWRSSCRSTSGATNGVPVWRRWRDVRASVAVVETHRQTRDRYGVKNSRVTSPTCSFASGSSPTLVDEKRFAVTRREKCYELRGSGRLRPFDTTESAIDRRYAKQAENEQPRQSGAGENVAGVMGAEDRSLHGDHRRDRQKQTLDRADTKPTSPTPTRRPRPCAPTENFARRWSSIRAETTRRTGSARCSPSDRPRQTVAAGRRATSRRSPPGRCRTPPRSVAAGNDDGPDRAPTPRSE